VGGRKSNWMQNELNSGQNWGQQSTFSFEWGKKGPKRCLKWELAKPSSKKKKTITGARAGPRRGANSYAWEKKKDKKPRGRELEGSPQPKKNE